MKKIKNLLLLIVVTTCLSGCVKFNAEMDIKKDKSMDFSVIYAIDTSVFGEEEILNEEDIKELEKNGFKIIKYEQNNMKGFTLTTKIKNIDHVSTSKDTEYNLSGILNENNENDKNYVFKIKKGILKNRYTAKFKIDASDSGLEDAFNSSIPDTDTLNNDDDMLENDLDNDWLEDKEEDENEFNPFDPDMDLENMMSNLDISFNVKLPYEALSSNASLKNNDNKNLTWNLSPNEEEYIKFEFELYNKTNIYILIAISIVILLIIAFIIFKKINKKNNNTNESSSIKTPGLEKISQTNVNIESDIKTPLNNNLEQSLETENSSIINNTNTNTQEILTEENIYKTQPFTQNIQNNLPNKNIETPTFINKHFTTNTIDENQKINNMVTNKETTNTNQTILDSIPDIIENQNVNNPQNTETYTNIRPINNEEENILTKEPELIENNIVNNSQNIESSNTSTTPDKNTHDF